MRAVASCSPSAGPGSRRRDCRTAASPATAHQRRRPAPPEVPATNGGKAGWKPNQQRLGGGGAQRGHKYRAPASGTRSYEGRLLRGPSSRRSRSTRQNRRCGAAEPTARRGRTLVSPTATRRRGRPASAQGPCTSGGNAARGRIQSRQCGAGSIPAAGPTSYMQCDSTKSPSAARRWRRTALPHWQERDCGTVISVPRTSARDSAPE